MLLYTCKFLNLQYTFPLIFIIKVLRPHNVARKAASCSPAVGKKPLFFTHVHFDQREKNLHGYNINIFVS
jgi:hypothetical protein